MAKWLFESGEHYLPFATLSYENFKDQVALGNDDLIGAVFCTKNYEAAGHVDKNWSEYAIGYVHEEGTVNKGHFFYPRYGIAIEMASNSIWCWKSKAVHSTARLNAELETWYTAVITLTENTAKSIEKRLNNWYFF